MIYAIAVFAPIFGSLVCGFAGRLIGDRPAQLITIACMLLASVCGVTSWYQHVFADEPNGTVQIATWIDAGSFHLDWALRYDTLSVSMVAMVTVVATLIHIYSTGYMAHEHSTTTRFFAYLSLFTFAMLMLCRRHRSRVLQVRLSGFHHHLCRHSGAHGRHLPRFRRRPTQL